MDEATIQQAGAYLQMIADVQNEGGVLSDEQQEMAILSARFQVCRMNIRKKD